jgi:hypothetical protein
VRNVAWTLGRSCRRGGGGGAAADGVAPDEWCMGLTCMHGTDSSGAWWTRRPRGRRSCRRIGWIHEDRWHEMTVSEGCEPGPVGLESAGPGGRGAHAWGVAAAGTGGWTDAAGWRDRGVGREQGRPESGCRGKARGGGDGEGSDGGRGEGVWLGWWSVAEGGKGKTHNQPMQQGVRGGFCGRYSLSFAKAKERFGWESD